MAKIQFRPSTLLGPLPAVMVSCGDMQNSNIITIAWVGIACSQPARVYISVRPDRFSHHLIKESGEYVINLTTERLVPACDYCGIRSGRDVDKFAEMKLTKEQGAVVSAPMIAESPVSLECKVFDVISLGSHDMFLADVVAVHADDSIVDEKGKIDFALARLVSYQHGDYYRCGRPIGRFGFAAQRKFIAKHGKGMDVDMSKATLTKRAPKKKK